MQNNGSNNIKKIDDIENNNGRIKQEELTLMILSEIICNVILKEINEYEQDESINDDKNSAV